ncbi:hypothetical protein CsSME_00012958 [Camellia sinensis var. sinensis]
MVRPKKRSTTTSAAAKPELRRPTTAERSAYFARREAAKVLRTVLNGDSNRRAVGSIKSLVYSPSIRNKKGTFALVCQTLKLRIAIWNGFINPIKWGSFVNSSKICHKQH